LSRYGRIWLPVLVAVALVLPSCGAGGAGSRSGGDMQGMDHGEGGQAKREGAKKVDGGMSGMNHSNMDHGSMGSGGMARQMVMEDGRYSDRAFIDAMVPHHRGAIDMAEVALGNAEHREVKELAEDIVSAQEAEIERLKAIKREEYGTSEVPMEMSAEEMEAMGMPMDPKEMAEREPFDKAFFDNMIPHHESAIDMANAALKDSENPEIRQIARAIVDAQEREIERMRAWRNEWYPEG
jgi:uncharacterized protein (DUF305 family)